MTVLTVGQLLEALGDFDPEKPVMIHGDTCKPVHAVELRRIDQAGTLLSRDEQGREADNALVLFHNSVP